MASKAEVRMNLSALQQRDPYITDIVDTASQVALYSFSSKTNEWEKTDVEGTLFVYTRSATPINGFMILNRLGLHDLIEPLNKNLEFQLQDPFLLYRNDNKAIYGIWFYDKDECARIGQLMNSLVQIALENQEQKEVNSSRQRRASESDTMPERAEKVLRPAPTKNVDIIKMLSKAQDEFDKAKAGPSQVQSQRVEPKPMIDNPNASATKTGSNLIKPLALKVCQTTDDSDTDAGAAGAVGGVGADAGATTPNTQISLDALFRRATLQQQQQQPQQPSGNGNTGPGPKTYQRSQSMHNPPLALGMTTGMPPSGMPQLLQRMMNNPVTTVEELERQHRGDIPRDQMPQPAGAEAPTEAPIAPAPTRVVSGAAKTSTSTTAFWQSLGSGGGGGVGSGGGGTMSGSQASPDTALKWSLNMLPTRIPTSVGSGITLPSTTSNTAVTTVSSSGGMMRTTSVHDQMMTHPQGMGVGLPDGKAAKLAQRLASLGTGTMSSTASGMSLAGINPPHSIMSRGTTSTGAIPSQTGSETQPSAGVLLTPMAFEMSPRVTPTHSTVLPPPSVFQSGGDGGRVSQASPLLAGAVGGLVAGVGHIGGAECQEITPLTREQLQQALVYLVRNDQDFMQKIHEAYVKSLTDGLLSQHKS